MSYQQEAKIEWIPTDEINQKLEERLKPQREEARLKAEQEAVEEKRKLEIFVAKGTLAYSERIAIEICERISSGELLINICADEHMPTVRRCNQWLNESLEFKGLYGASINDRLSIFEEEVIKIADDASRDFREVMKNGRALRVPDGEAIARAKLRVEVRFRHLKAGRPDKWGDSQTLITKSADGFDPASMTQ
jgi:terminase small subunit-like protein